MDYTCVCGNKQRQETPLKEFTEDDLEKIGWRKIDNKWVCPVCCNNKVALNNIDTANDLSCVCCTEGIESLKKKEEECLTRDGWFIHMIMNASDCPYDFNMHTHGLEEKFNHPDLQMCAPIEPKIAYTFLESFIGQIKKGVKYEIGVPIVEKEVFANDLSVIFAWAEEGSRDVLRIIFADKNGNLDPETMELSEQWEGTK